MHYSSRMWIGAISLTIATCLVLGIGVVRPALAQVAATSTGSTAATSPADRMTLPATTEATSTQPVENAATSTPAAPITSGNSSPAEPDNSGSATAATTAETPTEPPPAGLTEVHVIGTKYIDYFTDGSTTIAVPGDPNIDGNLDKPGAPTPTHAGMTWVHTIGENLYDTPSGDLEVGDYAVQPDGSYVQHAPPFVSSTSTPAELPAQTADNASSSGASSTTPTASSSTSPAVLSAPTSTLPGPSGNTSA